MSGTKIPICDEEILYTEKPDYLVLLSGIYQHNNSKT